MSDSLSPQQIWNQVLGRLEKQLSRPTFETWIKTATALRLQDNCLTICTPNPFILNHLQKHYLQLLVIL